MGRGLARWLAGAFAAALSLSASGARAEGFDFELALDGGPAWTFASQDYAPFEEPPLPSDHDEVTLLGPAGSLSFAFTSRVGDAFHLGGMLGVGGMGSSPPGVYRGPSPVFVLALGPTLAIYAQGDSPYAFLWVGFSYAYPQGPGVAAALGAGYRWSITESFALGLGVDILTRWSFDEEDGDFGRYSYRYGVVSPTVELRAFFGS